MLSTNQFSPISIALMADLFIVGLVKTIKEIILPMTPKTPIVTRTGPYITYPKCSPASELKKFVEPFVWNLPWVFYLASVNVRSAVTHLQPTIKSRKY